MKPVYDFLDACKQLVRNGIKPVAATLDRWSGGRLSPDIITFIGLAMHLPIAWLIGLGYFGYAAGLLVFFGLFDTLDGSLARLQGSASQRGMLLDSVTDRIKEVMLYTGAAYALLAGTQAGLAYWAVIACGFSLCVSYVNAWGEVVTAGQSNREAVNQTFRGGLARFEVRMFLLVAGLLTAQLAGALIVISILAGLTIIERLTRILKTLA